VRIRVVSFLIRDARQRCSRISGIRRWSHWSQPGVDVIGVHADVEASTADKAASTSAIEHEEKPTRKRKRTAQVDTPEPTVPESEQKAQGEAAEAPPPTKKKRKSKAEKEAEKIMYPLAARTVGHSLYIGAHVSSAGGVHNTVTNAVHVGANAFACFLKSQRKWQNPELSNEHQTLFSAHCKDHKYDGGAHVVPHGSYLVNLAHTDAARTKQAYDSFIDDLDRCRRLGIKLYNFHPGNSGGAESREEAIQHLAKQLNKAHADASSGDVVTLLETMASEGNTIGGTFEDLADTIKLVDAKERVGVCLDTCHVFAAGYDLRTPQAFKKTMDAFDTIVGFKYLRALHVNDSKAPLDSHRDLHANIGTGFLGLRSFHNLMNEPRLAGLPMVLETPIDVPAPGQEADAAQAAAGADQEDQSDAEEEEAEAEAEAQSQGARKGKKTTAPKKTIEDKGIWAREIKMLESLVGMDVESEEFRKMERELREQGRAERERIQGQIDRKAAKDKEKAEKEARKAAKGQKKKGPEKGQSKLAFGSGKRNGDAVTNGKAKTKGEQKSTVQSSSDESLSDLSELSDST